MLFQRLRVARLLAVLARQDPDQMVLEKIDGSGEHVVLHGLSLRPEAVNALAKILSSELGPLGWQVQVPNEQAREMLVGGGPWQFEVHIQDARRRPPANRPSPGRPRPTGGGSTGGCQVGPVGGVVVKLTQRERKLVLILPAVAVLIGYAWYYSFFRAVTRRPGPARLRGGRGRSRRRRRSWPHSGYRWPGCSAS